jgi:amino acid adenylation domain-containing protein
MNILDFLRDLRTQKIHLSAEGDKLYIDAPKGALTVELRRQLRQDKAELLVFLNQAQQVEPGVVAIPLVSRSQPLMLSFAQERLWFLNQFESQQSAYNIFDAWELVGPLEVSVLKQAMTEIVRRHEILRTTYKVHDNEPVQVIAEASSAMLAFELIEYNSDIATLMSQEAEEAFDLETGPLVRVKVVRLAAERHLLLITVHHIAYDGWSVGILMNELTTLYETFLNTSRLSVSPPRPRLRKGERAKERKSETASAKGREGERARGLLRKDNDNGRLSVSPPRPLAPSPHRRSPSPLAPLPLQYADFAQWQRKQLSGEALEKGLEYWKQQLSGAVPLLELPTDYPRPKILGTAARLEFFELSPSLTNKLKRLSQQSGSTLFMTLLAAFNVLLYRYSGEQDIVIGSPIANRHRSDIESLIGFFVNTLVLRHQLDGEMSFSELLANVRQSALEAYAHQEIPFEKVVEALQPERNMSYAPIFQVMFSLQNTPSSTLSMTGVTLKRLSRDVVPAQFDLILEMEQDNEANDTLPAEGLRGAFEYNTELFEAATIQRMAGHFVKLLESITANPEQALDKLHLLSFEEQYKLLVEWNQTESPYRHEATIHELFEEQVERSPNAIAVVCKGQSLTYQELNQRANQLAHHLQGLGIGPDILVGLCMERELSLVIAMLAILKAGGAYLPLDPSYPPERLSFMVENAQLSFLLTQEQLLGVIPGTSSDRESSILRSVNGKHYLAPLVICIDRDWPEIAQQRKDNPMTRVMADNLAYVIYTSGSTGKPKGVLVRHQGLVNHSLGMASRYGLRATDRVLQFASLSFDVAAEEFYPTWLSGAAVILRPDELGSMKAFGRLIEQERLTVLNLSSSYWHEWVHELTRSEQAIPAPLRLMIVGSEKVAYERVADWLALSGAANVRWFNAYGPSETTITATLYELDTTQKINRSSHAPRELPIGRPIPNTKLYLLDKQHHPVPIGVPGELYIGGDGLARGYLRAPTLTKERFIKNPFGAGRLYRTGDLTRYLPDGNLEFLGRVDHQVKIRGFRIELGEIEARLLQHPIVREGVVIVWEDIPGEPRLVAYFTASQQQEPTQKQWKIFFSQLLPHYMLPSAVIRLDSLPLMPNGKVNRRGLPAPSFSNEQQFVAPQTAMQQQLADLWGEILRVTRIGIHDNFFALGGHSLLATQVVSRLADITQVELSVRNLFEAPTIAELAEQIETIQWATQAIISDASMDQREEFEL